MQQKARGGPKGGPLGLVATVKRGADNGNTGFPVGIGLTRGH